MKHYDIIIIGGGIAGLNILYNFSKLYTNKTILLLESFEYLGGRISSIEWGNGVIEAGAARFLNTHTLLIQLIQELQLSQYVKSIGHTDLQHIHKGTIMNTHVYDLLQRVLTYASNVPYNILRTQNIITLATNILTQKEISFLKGFYGYYSELIVMNAYDTIQLMKNGTNPQNEFFILEGGLTQIINNMEQKILSSNNSHNIHIMKNKHVIQVLRTQGKNTHSFIVKCGDGSEFISNQYCIFALPKPCLKKFSILNNCKHLINSVSCQPFCRIYSYYHTPHNKWIKEFIQGKTTTNNVLRFIIPVGENTVMTSYTDHHFARWWKKKYDEGGIPSINRIITHLLRETFGTKHIPLANKTRIYFWECGVGYWKIDVNSNHISKNIIRANNSNNIFICGENYSCNYQQWIEGALETSNRVSQYIFAKFTGTS